MDYRQDHLQQNDKEFMDDGINNFSNIPSKEEIHRLFFELGLMSNLQQIRAYIIYRYDYLNNSNSIMYTESERALFYLISGIEPDVFFNSYFSDCFSINNPFSCLCSSIREFDAFNIKYQSVLLSIIYDLLRLKIEHPFECVFFLYKSFSSFREGKWCPTYETFCDIWNGLFFNHAIDSIFTDGSIKESGVTFIELRNLLSEMGFNTSYEKSLIILYSVLYRDYRKCEGQDKRVEKLRDGNEKIDTFKSPQAIFTLKSYDPDKPRFLNTLFESTAPNAMKSRGNWKSEFSYILAFFDKISLDLSLGYLLPEVFPSVSTVIFYLSKFPGGKNHSQERKIIEIICAYLYSIESNAFDKYKSFKTFLKNTISRDNLSDYKGIYNHLDKLHTSYAVIDYKEDNKYKKIYKEGKSLLLPSSKNESDKIFDYYFESSNDFTKNTKKLNPLKDLPEIPALDFLMEAKNNSKDSMVEDGIIFEETTNYIMRLGLNAVVLLQPSYSFLMKWLSDYRTKNLKTTIVIHDETVVKLLNKKLAENNLISKERYYRNQKTEFNLNIISSVDSIADYDLLLSFFNKTEPDYEDLVLLSRLLTDRNKMLCVFPQRFFENNELESIRKCILSYSVIERITYFSTNLFNYSPKKKALFELSKKNENNQKTSIHLRFIEINKELHEASGNSIKKDSGMYYIKAPTIIKLELDQPYNGESIDFKDVYRKQTLPVPKEQRNRPQEVVFAPDFKIYYTATNHGKSRQGRVFFVKYLEQNKKSIRKKEYGAKIKESQTILSAKDDVDIENKILEKFPLDDKFNCLRTVAVQEIKSALKGARLFHISLFTFTFAYSDEIKRIYSNYDWAFCYKALCRTALGALILNEASQENYDAAIAELINTNKVSTIKLLNQLEMILNTAVKNAVLYDSRSPIFGYIESKKKIQQTKGQMRSAFTTKTLSHEEEQSLVDWLLNHIPQNPVYLGTLIKLFTGMSSPEVCMLKWGDFCGTKYCDYYHFNVTKQMSYKSLEKNSLLSKFKYRIVPVPTFLSDIIIAQRERIQKRFRIPFAELMKFPMVAADKDWIADYCSVNKMRLSSQRALINGAGLSENIVSYPEADGSEEYDLSRYNADFYESNFKFHALNDAMMTLGEIDYILGLAPRDTFSRHYCDYSNPFLQIKLVEKLNDWCSIYRKREEKPQFESGTTNSVLRQKNIIISPYNSNCTSGHIELYVGEKCQSKIELSIASNRGVSGTATVYEDHKNEK